MQLGVNPRLLAAALWTTIVFFVGQLLVAGKNLLVPLVLAVFLWYLVNTLAGLFGAVRIGAWQPPAWLRYLLSGLTLLVAANMVVNIITSSVGDLIASAPLYQENLRQWVLSAQARIDFVEMPAASQLLAEFNFGAMIRGIASSFGSLVGNLGLIAMYMLFLFLEQRYFAAKFVSILPQRLRQQRVLDVLRQIDRDVRMYIGLKTLVSVITSLAAWLVMALVGLDFAAFWALLIFVLNFIPNIGSLVATLLPSLLALLQFDSLSPFLIVLIGVSVIQFLGGNVLEPSLMGKSLNVSPLAIILSLVAWGYLWGIAGMFLCVPITVIAMIVLYNFENTRWLALLLSQDGKLRERTTAASEPAA